MPFDAITGTAVVILLLPFFSFCLLFMVSRHLPGKGDVIATTFIAISFLLSVFVFMQVWNADAHLSRFIWFNVLTSSSILHFTISILVDGSAAVMLVIVTFISLLVHIYSLEYMKGKRNYRRFYTYLGIFTFAMLGIVLSDNLLITFMFWELVGFSSYLLIGFWYDKEEAVRAAKKAFLFNRIADLGFLLALFILWAHLQTFELTHIKTLESAGLIAQPWFTLLGLGIFCGCMGKSAQFPFQVWLPDAMEGPTPVSALIHAATMVVAGVYLLAKTFLLLSPDVLIVVACIGAITAIAGAIPAMVQVDIKKVLAYSTISQLGYMMMGIGVGAWSASLFHLMTHAFFKAGLFLAAGAVIHSMHHLKQELFDEGHYREFDAQDMRMMGGLRKKMPVTFVVFLVAALSLIGLPFFSGFLSKEVILYESWNWARQQQNAFLYIIPLSGLAVVFITAFYMARQLILVFFGEFRLAKTYKQSLHPFNHLKEVSYEMKIPLLALAALSTWVFFSISPIGRGWFLSAYSQEHLFSLGFVLVPLLLSVMGILLAWYFFSGNKVQKPILAVDSLFHRILIKNWYLDNFYYRFIIKSAFLAAEASNAIDRKIDRVIDLSGVGTVVAAHIAAWLDKGVVDGAVRFVVYLSGKIGRLVKSLQGGKIQLYYALTLFFVLLALLWIFFMV